MVADMAKFHGPIGYAESENTAPGVWEEKIAEYNYYGDVLRNTRRLEENGQTLNGDLTVGNSISVVADEYAYEHFFAIRYVKWAGSLWTVSDVEVQRPRLILRLGVIYDGPTAPAPVPS